MSSPNKVIPVPFGGGLNLAASTINLKPGEAVQLHNYEVNALGRYQSILGFECFDGKKAPSDVKPSELEGYPFATDEEEEAVVEEERALRRAVIAPVPGLAGSKVTGLFVFKGVVYAIRPYSETAAKMYKSTASGWQSVATPDLTTGTFKTVQANFTGSAGTKEIIGCNGTGKAFRFDGNTLTFIDGPITPDQPLEPVVLPSQVLLMAYRNGSIVGSAVGDPTKWSPIDGGVEIGLADEFAGFSMQPNNSCAVFCRNRTYILYGKSKLDFNLTDLSTETGAIAGSIQSIGDSIYLDDRGLTRLNRVQQFGNFAMAAFSQNIDPLLKRYVGRVSTSWVVKNKNQYRLCFDDSTGIIVSFFGDQVSGFSTFSYNIPIRLTCSAEGADGQEVIYFASDDGFVYQADKGFSFNGEAIQTVLRPAFYSPKPGYNFRWRKVTLEADMVGSKLLTLQPEFDFSNPSVPSDEVQYSEIAGGGGFWDQGTWDETAWSAAVTFRTDIHIDGVAENMSLLITTSSTKDAPHILNSMLVHVSPRGRLR